MYRETVRPASFREEACIILNEVDQAPIFNIEPKRWFPSFEKSEVKLGAVLGIGGFGIVREVTSFVPIAAKDMSTLDSTTAAEMADASSNNEISLGDLFALETGAVTDSCGGGSNNNTTTFGPAFRHDSSLGDDSHYDASSAREIMTRRCIRNGDARYAVKALMKEDLNQMEFEQGRVDLAIEVKYLQALNHPNIVKLRGLFATDDPLHPNYFFIMDRLYGTLGLRIKEWKAALSKIDGRIYRRSNKILMKEQLATRLTVAYDIASAINYMHARDLLHRDLKPENIGFDIRGDVKVFDFGLAKSLLPTLRASNGMYRLTGLTGSYPYMAPEVAKGDLYDEKCDVFSFGILFWEVIVLKQPFPRLRTHNECLTRIAIGGLRPPMPRFKKLSPVIQEIMTLSWKESPQDRPSMKDIKAMLCAQLRALKREYDTVFRSLMLAEKSRRSIHQSMLLKQQQSL